MNQENQKHSSAWDLWRWSPRHAVRLAQRGLSSQSLGK